MFSLHRPSANACGIVLLGLSVGLASSALHLPACPVFAVATTLIVLVMATRTTPRRDLLATGISATIGAAALLCFAARWALEQPLVGSGPDHLPKTVLPFLGILILFGACALSVPLRAWLVKAGGLHRLLVVAVTLLIVGGVTTAAGLRLLHRPAPDDYLKLFTHTTLAPSGKVSIGSGTLTYVGWIIPVNDTWSRAWSTPRNGNVSHCEVEVATGWVVHNHDVAVSESGSCPLLHVYADEATGTLLMQPDGTRGRPQVVLGPASELLARDLRGRLGAPFGWVIGGVLGLGLAVFAIAAAFATRRRSLADLANAIDGEHTGAGWVTIDGGAPRFVAELATSPPGPVVVTDHVANLPTYRDHGAAEAFTVTLGNRQSFHAAALSRASTWATVAILAVVTTMTPLWVARSYGLL